MIEMFLVSFGTLLEQISQCSMTCRTTLGTRLELTKITLATLNRTLCAARVLWTKNKKNNLRWLLRPKCQVKKLRILIL